MKRNEARVQMLALALMAVFALLCLDLEPVQAVIHDYGLGADAAVAETEPAPDPRSLQGPSLAVGGEAKPVKAPSSRPVLPILAVAPEAGAHVNEDDTWLAAPEPPVGRVLHEEPRWTTIVSGDRKSWSTLEAAAHDLALSAAQRVSWGRTIEDARRDMDDLRHVPNGEGACWHDFMANARPQHAGDSSGALALRAALATFVTTELNGGETFVTARQRILTSYKDRLRTELQPTQVEIFRACDVAPLLEGVQIAVAARPRLGFMHHSRARIVRRKS